MVPHGSFERLTTSPTLLLLLSLSVLLAVYAFIHTFFIRKLPINAPPSASGNLPISGSFAFWTKRWEFCRNSRDRTLTGNYSFHAGSNAIVGLSGEQGRRLFFESKELGFNEGYAVLFGSTPPIEAHDDGSGKQEELSNHFNRRLAYLLKNEQFRKKLPTLISDVKEGIEWIKNDPRGITDPFESIYRIVFKLTIRMVGADEIAQSPELCEQTLKLFEMIDSSATAVAVMFPRLPSPAVLKRTYAGARLYMLVEKIVKKRAESGEKHDDALQHLLDQGDRMFKIIEFIVGALFAGLLNSGINAARVLCFLACSPEWLSKAREEVRVVAAKYAKDPNAPLRHQLDDVPLEAWENEFPVVDMCLRDSIRLNLVGNAFRKNISGRAIPIGNGEVIPPNAFVTYALGDLHLDPNIYPDPETWDPSRYSSEKAEDKRAAHGFLGWGAARHPCGGMRFAKLEQNMITAYFLASFDFHLEDQKGNKMTTAPKVDQNRNSAHKPTVRPLLRVTSHEK